MSSNPFKNERGRNLKLVKALSRPQTKKRLAKKVRARPRGGRKTKSSPFNPYGKDDEEDYDAEDEEDHEEFTGRRKSDSFMPDWSPPFNLELSHLQDGLTAAEQEAARKLVRKEPLLRHAVETLLDMRAPEYEYLVRKRIAKPSRSKAIRDKTTALVDAFEHYKNWDEVLQREFYHVDPNPMLDDLVIHLDLGLQNEWNILHTDPDKYIKYKLKHIFPDNDEQEKEPFGVGNEKSPHRRFHRYGLDPATQNDKDLDSQGKPYHPPIEDLLAVAFTTAPTPESAELFKRAINGVDDDFVYNLKVSDMMKRPKKTTTTIEQLNELLNNPQLRNAFKNPYRLPKSKNKSPFDMRFTASSLSPQSLTFYLERQFEPEAFVEPQAKIDVTPYSVEHSLLEAEQQRIAREEAEVRLRNEKAQGFTPYKHFARPKSLLHNKPGDKSFAENLSTGFGLFGDNNQQSATSKDPNALYVYGGRPQTAMDVFNKEKEMEDEWNKYGRILSPEERARRSAENIALGIVKRYNIDLDKPVNIAYLNKSILEDEAFGPKTAKQLKTKAQIAEERARAIEEGEGHLCDHYHDTYDHEYVIQPDTPQKVLLMNLWFESLKQRGILKVHDKHRLAYETKRSGQRLKIDLLPKTKKLYAVVSWILKKPFNKDMLFKAYTNQLEALISLFPREMVQREIENRMWKHEFFQTLFSLHPIHRMSRLSPQYEVLKTLAGLADDQVEKSSILVPFFPRPCSPGLQDPYEAWENEYDLTHQALQRNSWEVAFDSFIASRPDDFTPAKNNNIRALLLQRYLRKYYQTHPTSSTSNTNKKNKNKNNESTNDDDNNITTRSTPETVMQRLQTAIYTKPNFYNGFYYNNKFVNFLTYRDNLRQFTKQLQQWLLSHYSLYQQFIKTLKPGVNLYEMIEHIQMKRQQKDH